MINLRVAGHAVVFTSIVWAGSCASTEGPRPILGSTYWIGEAEQGKESDVFLEVFTSREDCATTFDEATADACMPMVDRATGQMRLSFQTLDKATMLPYPLPLARDDIQVLHNQRVVPESAKSGVELAQKGPRRSGQLFVLLIDGSASMYENDAAGMRKLEGALLNPKVKAAFFPEDVETGVVPLRFSQTVKGLDGGPPVVIETRKQYDRYIRDHLRSADRGWTHFYEAVDYSLHDLMEEKSLTDWLAIHKGEPTIIALTDGFTNHSGSDTCATNVPRLRHTLEELDRARGLPLGLRPTVYTVGLGQGLFRNLKEIPPSDVTAHALCGPHKDAIVSGYLEALGVDNNSLRWIAERGGGTSFIRNDADGLAEVFQEAAAMRYGWYTVSYKVDPFYHRQKFETTIRVTSYARAEATLEVFPSGWIDAPTGTRASGQRWTSPTPMRSTFSLVMPLLGGLVVLAFWGPAGFNARRAVFRRVRGKAPPPGPGA